MVSELFVHPTTIISTASFEYDNYVNFTMHWVAQVINALHYPPHPKLGHFYKQPIMQLNILSLDDALKQVNWSYKITM